MHEIMIFHMKQKLVWNLLKTFPCSFSLGTARTQKTIIYTSEPPQTTFGKISGEREGIILTSKGIWYYLSQMQTNFLSRNKWKTGIARLGYNSICGFINTGLFLTVWLSISFRARGRGFCNKTHVSTSLPALQPNTADPFPQSKSRGSYLFLAFVLWYHQTF